MNTPQTLALLDCTRDTMGLIYQLRANQAISIEQLNDALDHCQTTMKKHLYTESMIEKTYYLLCIAIDEAYANCAAKQPGTAINLLAKHYRQSNGGECFFDVLEHYLNFNDEYRPLLELCFMILGSGFRGKYALHKEGAAILLKKRQQLSNLLYGDYQLPNVVVAQKPTRLAARLLHARIFHKKYWLTLVLIVLLLLFGGNAILHYQVNLLQANVTQSQRDNPSVEGSPT